MEKKICAVGDSSSSFHSIFIFYLLIWFLRNLKLFNLAHVSGIWITFQKIFTIVYLSIICMIVNDKIHLKGYTKFSVSYTPVYVICINHPILSP